MGKKAPREPFRLRLGEWLEFFELGPSEAASLAGCTQPYISNMIAGRKSNINVEFLLSLTEELGITVNDLYRPAPTKLQVAHLKGYSDQAQAAILKRARKKS